MYLALPFYHPPKELIWWICFRWMQYKKNIAIMIITGNRRNHRIPAELWDLIYHTYIIYS